VVKLLAHQGRNAQLASKESLPISLVIRVQVVLVLLVLLQVLAHQGKQVAQVVLEEEYNLQRVRNSVLYVPVVKLLALQRRCAQLASKESLPISLLIVLLVVVLLVLMEVLVRKGKQVAQVVLQAEYNLQRARNFVLDVLQGKTQLVPLPFAQSVMKENFKDF